MIEPANFYSNPETVSDNSFQSTETKIDLQALALREFTALMQAIERTGVKVIKFCDLAQNKTPDSIYPNNWISTHAESTLIIYPMKADNRRRERRNDIIESLRARYKRIIDLRHYENQGLYLEGTGSLVLDRINKCAYACISERTNEKMLPIWCEVLGYAAVPFRAYGIDGNPIYHTNVMMNITSKLAIVCMDAIKEKSDKDKIRASLGDSEKQLIEITQAQINQFCGNVLELAGKDGSAHLLVSQNALRNFSSDQCEILEAHFDSLISVDLTNIEKFGGGGARCMVLEVF